MKKSGKSHEPQSASAMESITDVRSHKERFAFGVKLFSAGDFERASEAFASASRGPEISINEPAMMYARMCEQRLARLRAEQSTPDQLFVSAKELLRQGRYPASIQVLENCLRANETAQAHYALAIATGHIGDASAAARHFKRACELDPAIRVAAKGDADFQALLQFSEVRDALSERG